MVAVIIDFGINLLGCKKLLCRKQIKTHEWNEFNLYYLTSTLYSIKMWYSVYLEVIFLMVIWRKGSRKQRLKSGYVRINLNHGALALNSYSHRSVPAHRNFCWAMKFLDMVIKSLNNSRCDSVMKVFMAEQSKVPRSCAGGCRSFHHQGPPQGWARTADL